MNRVKPDKPHVDTDIDPPIDSRTTKQLLEIFETKEQWRDDVLRLTQEELVKRGVSLNAQDHRRNIRKRFQKRIESIKSRATYTTTEKNINCHSWSSIGYHF